VTTLAVAQLRDVRLYGVLGRQFGRVFRLAVSSPAEAVRALSAVLPGFERAFLGRDGRQAYHVFVGRGKQRRDLGEEEVGDIVGSEQTIRFVPVIAGAKRGGVLQTVVGYALMVAGAYVSIYSPAAGSAIAGVGLNMMLGGVIQMLSPQRAKEDRGQENRPSYAFDGPVNETEQGGPVPVVFGRVICGSTVVSQGLSTVQIVQPEPPVVPDPPLPPWEWDSP
jgi:predicted phage tail protein